jgi:hypothetical protein
VILEDCVNIPDDLETVSPNYFVNGSAQYVNDHYYLNMMKKFYLSTNYLDITPTLDNELTSKYYVDTEINTKQDIITDESITIARTDGLQTALTALQDDIAINTANIATNTADILTKQPLITTSTYLTANSITTNNLKVNGNINLNKTNFFNTIVIRRPTGITGGLDTANNNVINSNELQVWVNDTNIMINNGLTSFYVNFNDKDTIIKSSAEEI